MMSNRREALAWNVYDEAQAQAWMAYREAVRAEK